MNSEIVMYQTEDGLTKIQVDKHCRMEEITMTKEERIFARNLIRWMNTIKTVCRLSKSSSEASETNIIFRVQFSSTMVLTLLSERTFLQTSI